MPLRRVLATIFPRLRKRDGNEQPVRWIDVADLHRALGDARPPR